MAMNDYPKRVRDNIIPLSVGDTLPNGYHCADAWFTHPGSQLQGNVGSANLCRWFLLTTLMSGGDNRRHLDLSTTLVCPSKIAVDHSVDCAHRREFGR